MASSLKPTLPGTQVAFVVNNLPDLDTLLDGLPQGIEVNLLDHSQDGLTQMAATLQGRSGIDSLHLLSHGEVGRLMMGSVEISRLDLPYYHNELHTISRAINHDGVWMIYGCEVAAGDEGHRFVEDLRLMTGLQIAAASHKVGAQALGGSWDLDYGMAGKQKALSVPQWQGVLACAPFPEMGSLGALINFTC